MGPDILSSVGAMGSGVIVLRRFRLLQPYVLHKSEAKEKLTIGKNWKR